MILGWRSGNGVQELKKLLQYRVHVSIKPQWLVECFYQDMAN